MTLRRLRSRLEFCHNFKSRTAAYITLLLIFLLGSALFLIDWVHNFAVLKGLYSFVYTGVKSILPPCNILCS